jgi:hypothetical protein
VIEGATTDATAQAPPRRRAARAVVGPRRQRRAPELVADLRALQKKFPHFAGEIERLINELTRLAGRTRTRDRDDVLATLEAGQRVGVALSAAEIAADAGLSRWTVDGILAAFVAARLVDFTERTGGRGRPLRCYRLTHTKP